MEVQVRTALQHVWAQLSVKVAETFGAAVKYGGGPVDLRDLLDKASSSGGNLEMLAQKMAAVEQTSAARKPLEIALAETSHEYLRCLGAIITKASKQ